MEISMKVLVSTVMAGLLTVSLAVSADAATKREMRKAHVQHERSCKTQAANKYSAIHFMKRRAFVKHCMGGKA
jgi:hypothetical protein